MAISFDFKNNPPVQNGQGLESMMGELARINGHKPVIQMEEGNYRLAMLWPDMMGEMLPSLPHDDRDALVNEQLWMEYEQGVPCWIQRKVVNHFNTFSTECWV